MHALSTSSTSSTREASPLSKNKNKNKKQTKSRNKILQNKQNLQESLQDSKNEVVELTSKLSVITKRVQQQDKIIALRDNTIKALTDKCDELHSLLDAQKAARTNERSQDNYLEKVRNNLIRGWYLCDKLEIRSTSVWQTATGKSIGRTLISTVDYLPTDVTNGIRVVRFHGTVLSLTKQQLRKRKRSQYLLYLRKDTYLDCESQTAAGTCKASMSNCVRNLEHVHLSTVRPQANMKLVLDQNDRDVLWLEVIEILLKADELFWNYGSAFQLPPDISSLLHSSTAPDKDVPGVTSKRKNLHR